MAVSAFHNDRDREGSDMLCDPHGPHPLSGVVADRLPLVQRLHLFYTERRALSIPAAPMSGCFCLRDDWTVNTNDCVVPAGKQLYNIVHAVFVLGDTGSH